MSDDLRVAVEPAKLDADFDPDKKLSAISMICLLSRCLLKQWAIHILRHEFGCLGFTE
jgi:hypothetical protein